MKILIIEDEKLSFQMHRDMLMSYFSNSAYCTIDGPLISIDDVIEYFKSNEAPDLILSDIRLLDGLVFSALDNINCKSRIIFMTAYPEYAVKSFQYNVIHYLLKPVDKMELYAALEKSMQYPKENLADIHKFVNTYEKKKRFLINHKGDFYVVATKDVSHFYYRDNALSLYDFSQNNYILELSIDDCEKLLDNNMFFRVNRQCIVNINSIKKIVNFWDRRLKIVLKNYPDEDIFVSRRRSKDFKRWLEA